mmetsp:Transcript_20274/g.56214  ORF Transcript_20274/g.56214 Transcript_20274/m.56214 type:complete len:544 (+) Transcript_20274:56-1687(+)|eukprot:CAMPEP_0117660522 /NCGR_PEP_ID=MMETSP0804-20121206/7013_1 /TAXON_ID=1074897 /ORGANISM="Tetraselmis astigmatica, Strain CCMP880" /LENGTH=543 /DNA_ID=CAMNT_0005467257 /DNA_START=113 /DNA_END=1744 /DNA_ORIENTATION=+
MSFHIQASMMQIVAQSMNIPNLSDEAAQALAPDVEYRLREIIQEAMKFMRHSKRLSLATVDIDHALRLKNIEPLYGFSNKNPARFVRAAGFPDVFYVEDHELTIDQVIEAPLPQCPVEIGVMTHWLAVHGVQPDIPENAPLEPKARKRVRDPEAGAAPPQRAVAQPGVPSQMLRPGEAAPAPSATVGGKAGGKGAGKDSATEDVQVRVPVKHELSKESQLYLQRVQAILESAAKASTSRDSWAEDGGNEKERAAKAAAESNLRQVLRGLFAGLACDPGLHQLMPYLRFYITEKVASSLKDVSMLSILLKATRCLVINPHIDVEGHLAQVMPAVLTCLVAQRLGPKEGPQADHWQLRREAADLTALICQRFGPRYPNLQSRITKQLHNALVDAQRPMSTHYGAVVGLAALGPRVTQLLVLPHAAQLVQRLEKPLASAAGQRLRMEAHHLLAALQAAVGSCMRNRVLEQMDLPAKRLKAGTIEPPVSDTATKEAKGEGGGPAGGTLETAWKENSALERDIESVNEVFGDAMMPFLPAAAVACLLV